jgi:hypothetical protein
MKRDFSIISVKSSIFHESQDNQFRHLALKQVISDLRLGAGRDGERFHFHPSQWVFSSLGTQLLIDEIEGAGLTFLTHNTIL